MLRCLLIEKSDGGRMVRTVLTAAAIVGLSVAAWHAAIAADPVVNFAGSSATFAGDCHGQTASLAGSNNLATIHGGCRDFQIAGGDNRVLVEMAAGGTIRVYGSNNQVSWSAPGEVEVTAVGQNNTVVRAH